jgi:hypothetical protein
MTWKLVADIEFGAYGQRGVLGLLKVERKI